MESSSASMINSPSSQMLNAKESNVLIGNRKVSYQLGAQIGTHPANPSIADLNSAGNKKAKSKFQQAHRFDVHER